MNLGKLDSFACFLVRIIEKYLSYRSKKKYLYKLKTKKRGFFLNFLVDLFFAMLFVLVVNQYFLQAYKIPSGSMEDTLKVGDFLFVDKFSYGPELLPGGILKINGITIPQESDTVIFENPEYISKGFLFDLLQRVFYMLSLSLIDIDRDESGNPQVRFLVKRALFDGGKFVRFKNGKVYLRNEGEDEFITEEEYKTLKGYDFIIKKLVKNEDYGFYNDFSMHIALNQLNINLFETPDFFYLDTLKYTDSFEIERLKYKYLSVFMPYVGYYFEKALISNYGIYIPEGYVLPIGDNRDNSYDGRFFGVINKNKILGKTLFRYFPFFRIGFL